MGLKSNSADTAIVSYRKDQEFILQKLREFALFKKQVSDWMENCEEVSCIRTEIENDTDTLFSKLLSVYGLMIESEMCH